MSYKKRMENFRKKFLDNSLTSDYISVTKILSVLSMNNV